MSKSYRFVVSYRARIGKTDDGRYKWKRFEGHSNSSKEKAMEHAKANAKAWMAMHKDDIEEYVDQLTLGTAFDEYIASKENILSPVTIRAYIMIRRNYLQSIMKMSIYDITQIDVQRAINHEAATKSPKTIRNIHGLLCSVLTMYRPEFVLHTTLPPKMPVTPHVPSNDEIAKLLECAKLKNRDLYIAILLAAFGSMRRSEICALTYEDITGCTICVKKAKIPNKNGEYVVQHRTKSAASTRTITLPAKIVSEICETHGSGEILSIKPHQITNQFARLLRSNEIPHFRFHDLRHYQASILHAMGVPDKYIMERGGWKTDATLKNVYQHTMDDTRKEVEKAICDYFTDKFL